MTRTGIREDAGLLVERRIDSMEMRDALLVVHGSPGRAWTAAETVRAPGGGVAGASRERGASRE